MNPFDVVRDALWYDIDTPEDLAKAAQEALNDIERELNELRAKLAEKGATIRAELIERGRWEHKAEELSAALTKHADALFRASADVLEQTARADRAEAKLAACERQEPVVWAISYDGKTPYSLFGDDCALLDAEVARQGGTTCKMPLYANPIAPPAPVVKVTDEMAERVSELWDALPMRRDCEPAAAHGYDMIAAVQQVLGPTLGMVTRDELARAVDRIAELERLLGEAREDVVDCLNEAQNERIEYHARLLAEIDKAMEAGK